MTNPLVDSPGTLLGDGRVLFVASSSTGDLYDPKSGKFTPLPPSPLLRGGATATLLHNGKVLFTGTSPLDDATRMETYDPTTGKFTSLAFTPPAGTAESPKACAQALYYQPSPQTATLLSDGRVLFSVCSYLETYDPASAVFAPAGQISTLGDLNRPSATRLSDGRVLFSGGELITATRDDPVASASLYDPATGPQAAPSMTTAREYHTTTLLPDGRVLIVGGTMDGTNALASAELFVP